MPDLADGEIALVKGSAADPYQLKNTGGVYTCTCPAWRNQHFPPEARTCKHLKGYRGEAAELARVGSAAAGPARPKPAPKPKVVSADGKVIDEGEAKDDEGPPILLAHKWDATTDITGWWMSEKLDGVRAYWDGTQFISRLGNLYVAPEWFTAGLPNVALDGELFGGRKKFQDTVGVVRRHDKPEGWKEIRYVVFDAPALSAAFEDRLEFFTDHLAKKKPAYAVAHPHEKCASVDHLKKELKRVEDLGGEGLMLRKPGSKYEVGRSWSLLKVKTFHDAEALVLKHLPGEGKHKGRCGALEAQLPNGKKFHIGTGLSDAERKDPPAIGSVVTFRYFELTEDGIPRFPSYVGVRIDLSWEQVKKQA